MSGLIQKIDIDFNTAIGLDYYPYAPKFIMKGGNIMMKKVAVIVSDDQHEGLRMGVGLTLGDNAVTVFLMDKPLESSDDIDLNVETLGDMDAKVYSNDPGSKCEIMSTEEIARALTDFDAVIRY